MDEQVQNVRAQLKNRGFGSEKAWTKFLNWWDSTVEPGLIHLREKVPKEKREEYQSLEREARKAPKFVKVNIINGYANPKSSEQNRQIGAAKMLQFEALLDWLEKFRS